MAAADEHEQGPVGAGFDQTNGLMPESREVSADEVGDRNDAPMPLKRVGAARDFGLRIHPTDAAGRTEE